jgi:hypothetical protein
MIPKNISKISLREITPANETHIVRVVLHDVSNESRYTLRCRSRTYIFERHPSIGRHALDIPLSLWMEGVATGARWKDNTSIPEDIRNSPRSVSIHILPIDNLDVESTESSDGGGGPESAFSELHRLLGEFGAPDAVRECVKLVEGGAPFEEVRSFVDSAIAALEDEEPESTPLPSDESPAPETPSAPVAPAPALTPAERLAKAREAKKAKAEAEKAAAAAAAKSTTPEDVV